MENKKNKYLYIVVLITCLIPVGVILTVYNYYTLPKKDKKYIINLAGNWKAKAGHNQKWISPQYNDSDWKRIELPGRFCNYGITEKKITIRKNFKINQNMRNKDLIFFMSSPHNLTGILYINGKKIDRFGLRIGQKDTTGQDDKFVFKLNPDIINSKTENLAAIEFTSLLTKNGGIRDSRIYIGEYNRLKIYADKNIRINLFFQYGTILASFSALIIILILLYNEKQSKDRNKYRAVSFFLLSAIFYNIFHTNTFVRYYINYTTLLRCIYVSIIFICLTSFDFFHYFFSNRKYFFSKINWALCIILTILIFIVPDINTAFQIYRLFAAYFIILIIYMWYYGITMTIKLKGQPAALMVTISSIIASATGISDLMVDLGFWEMPMLFNITISTFVMFGTIMIIADFIKINRTNKILSFKMRELNTNLENIVRERTKELSLANKKLTKMDELKNDFIANITHDFRSPLTAILNIADLNLRIDPKNPYKEDFKTILASSYRMKNFIDRLLDLARLDSRAIKLHIKKLDIVKFITDITEYYQSAIANTTIKFKTIFPEKTINDFYSDERKLDEILSNVIANSIKYVDTEKGEITITVENSKDSILITVADNGIGIPADKLGIIFDRFEQLEIGRNTQYGGSGIGLAFAKQLVEFMQGKMWAESEGENKGSKFFIQVKKSKRPAAAKKTSDDKIVPPNDTKNLIQYNIEKKMHKGQVSVEIIEKNTPNEFDIKKGVILIIDDDPIVAKIVKGYLRINGFNNFIVASSGNLGLNAIFHYTPDIILCDYNMPYLSGSEIHDKIIHNPDCNQIPFIFISAIADQNLIIERRSKGASAYLKKPIDESDLIVTVTLHIKKYFEQLKSTIA